MYLLTEDKVIAQKNVILNIKKFLEQKETRVKSILYVLNAEVRIKLSDEIISTEFAKTVSQRKVYVNAEIRNL
ncbi:hypothetical protein IKN40_07885 [bacterium]|nr:hypothetical protein [bacterium]